jgi:hypothetical protein
LFILITSQNGMIASGKRVGASIFAKIGIFREGGRIADTEDKFRFVKAIDHIGQVILMGLNQKFE